MMLLLFDRRMAPTKRIPLMAGETAAREAVEEKRNQLLVKRERLFRLAWAVAGVAKEVDRELKDCVAAGRCLGVNVALPDWKNVHKTSLEEEMERATGFLYWARPEPPLDRYNNDDGLLRDILAHIDDYEARQVRASARKPTLRAIVLGRLDEAGVQGVKADKIRDYIENNYPGSFHPKTVGMTLHRLLKEGIARRDGRIWRRVAEDRQPPKR
jgi:hypothetical protein